MAEPTPIQGVSRTPPFPVHSAQGLTQFYPPIHYFNGFSIILGSADFSLGLNIDNAPALSLKCSYTTAKTFAQKLQDAVKQFESITDYDLLTSDAIAQAMQQTKPEPAK